MKSPLIIYWARRDLRIADNPALLAASIDSRGRKVPLLPLFILEEYMLAGLPEHQFGYPSRWFLSSALPKLGENLPGFTVVRGKASSYLIALASKYQLTIYVNDDVYIDFYKQVEKLRLAGIEVIVSEDALSVSKETKSKEGNLYSVFTPFKKSVWVAFTENSPKPTTELDKNPDLNEVYKNLPDQVTLNQSSIWELFSKARTIKVGDQVFDIDKYVPELPNLTNWYFDESEAIKHFASYLKSGDLDRYDTQRDSLELDAIGNGKTSKMSLALAWGLVSARSMMSMIQKYYGEKFDNPFSTRVSAGAITYISELIWREFYRYQMFHRPELMSTEFQTRFRGSINWVKEDELHERFVAFIKGETGYGVVDAAMKQISATGWMHNRSRMIVASILTKNFGVDWRIGQEYFRAMLIDLDEASNNGGWQWGASVGTDPKPIRIFNPGLQAKNHDSNNAYQDRWLGESLLKGERVPLVEHKLAREEALERYGLKGVEPRDY